MHARPLALALLLAAFPLLAPGPVMAQDPHPADSVKAAGRPRSKARARKARALPDSVKVPAVDTTLTVELEKQYTDEFLDSLDLNAGILINDYFMVGVEYGVDLTSMQFNPDKKQGMLFTPLEAGVTFTYYNKMFGLLPYFGLQAGFHYGHTGYKFNKTSEGEYTSAVDGAVMARYKIVEADMLSQFHADFWKMKLLAEAGLYGGYRLSVHREGEAMDPAYADAFHDYDRRFEYGAKFGAGFAFVFDPVEIHIKANYRWGWSSLYEPDYNSPYYYRFAYPSDIIVSVGLHFQLTKRTGKTTAQLRREAREAVYNAAGR